MGYYKVNVTLLDSFVNYVDFEDQGSVDRFIEEIKGGKRSELLSFGVGFHHFMESEDISLYREGTNYVYDTGDGGIVCLDCDFIEGCRLALDSCLRSHYSIYPIVKPIWELRLEESYRVLGEEVLLVGKVDGILGDLLELKTTHSSFSYDRYWSSIQWRCYMELSGLCGIRYMVYELGCKEGFHFLRGFHDFRFVRDNNFVYRLQGMLGDFLDFIRYYELESYFYRV
jgi:hypothetical protein